MKQHQFKTQKVNFTLQVKYSRNVLTLLLLLLTTALTSKAQTTFQNTANINVPGSGTSGNASPYSSNIAVSGMSGVISKVTVTLTNVSHANPDDIDVVVQSPTGINVILMSDVGGSTDITNRTYVFDDAAANAMSNSGANAAGTYQPTNSGTPDNFPSPGPGNLTQASPNLSDFDGTNPNGTWKLFVVDDAFFSSGSISGGWKVTITSCTPPTASASNNGPVCPGSSLNLSSSGGVSYSWSGPNSYSSTSQNPTISNIPASGAGTYTVTVTGSGGCTSTATTVVTLKTAPTATASNSGAVCSGGNVTISSSGGTGYSWSGPNSYTSSSQNNTLTGATSTNAGTYTVTVTNAAGCTANATTNVVVNSYPTAVASNNGPVCSGATLNLTSSGGSTYSWSGPNSYTSTSQNPSITNATNVRAGVYTVVVTSSAGCSSSTTTTVAINSLPTPTASSNSPVCENTNIDLTASGGNSYSWTGPNGYTSSAQNPTIVNATANRNGVYTVTVTGANGCTATATSSVSINPSPSGTPTVSNATVCPGTSVTLNANQDVNYGGVNNTSFAIPDNNTTGISSPIYALGSGVLNANQVTSVTINITHTYDADLDIYLVAPNGSQIELSTDNGGSGNNYTNTVFQTGSPSVTTGSTPFNGTYAPEQAFSLLTGTAHGTWNLLVKDDAAIDVGTLLNWTLNLTSASGVTVSWTSTPSGFTSSSSSTTDNPSVNTTYNVASTFSGCTSNSTVAVAVNPAPNIMVTSNAPICDGQDLTISASGGSTYVWSGPNSFTSASSSFTLSSANESYEGTYSVVVVNAFGCSSSSSLLAEVNPNPVLAITSQTNVTCNGGSDGAYQIDATGGSGFYLFSNGIDLNFDGSFTGLNANSYSIEVIDGNGCLSTIPATVTEPDPTTISNAGSDESACNGTSVSLSANNAIVGTGSWSVISGSATFNDAGNPNAMASGFSIGSNVLRWTIDNGVCGSNYDDKEVFVNELPSASFESSTAICLGGNANLTVNFTGSGPWSYQVNGGATQFSNFNPAIFTSTPTSTTNYTITSVSDANCPGSGIGSALVTVNTAPPAGTIATSLLVFPGSACNGNVVNVSANNVPNANGYTWSVPGGTLINGQVGPITTLTPNATLTLGYIVPNVSNWQICVFGENACGITNQKCFSIRGNLSTPAPISGSDVACSNTTQTYSVPVVGGAENYVWSGSGGISVVSGAGTNNVTVSFAPGFTQGTLCVAAGLNCGYVGSSRCMTIKNATAPLGQMAGPFALCPGQINQVFSVPAVNGAASYNWTVPSNISIVSGQGTPTIAVNVGNGFYQGQLCVTVTSNCGIVSAPRCKTVYTTAPPIPGNISGASFGVCGQTITYSVASISGVSSYNWSIPAGATFSSPNGNNSVDVTFGNNFTTGQICVASVNNCGVSGTRCISIKGTAADPSAISGPASVCQYEQGTMFSIDPVQGASGYLWTIPNGAAFIAGQNTTSIIVDWGVTGGTITVRALNNCGQSGTRTLNVAIGCRMSTLAPKSISVYPNPTSGNVNISFDAKTSGATKISIEDLSGRTVLMNDVQVRTGANNFGLDVSKLQSGIYLVKIQVDDKSSVARLIVE